MLRILGVMGAGDDSSVLVAPDAAPSTWLRLDDTLAGWTLTAIGPDWIELTRGDAVQRLEMFP
ncbi:hypothetical protein [Jannaschia pohangensis]|nr:hypothetical protein [Jannaschia pohangensis]